VSLTHLLLSWPHSLTVAARDVAMAICLLAAAYNLFACFAARAFFARKTDRDDGLRPPVTILKPLRGVDRDAYDNFASFCRQSYPRYQVIFGADESDGPAIAIARRIANDFPHIDVRVVVKPPGGAANPKVGNLAAMLSEAEHALLLISDSDIRVDPNYLAAMVQPLANPRVGVVTCLYRSQAVGFAGTLAGLGLSTDGQPSVLAAIELEKIGLSRFGSAVGAMGSGILIRSAVLREVGGFDAIADFLADDYLLGSLPAKAGYRVALSSAVVEHRLGKSTLAGLIQNQMRWNRGIRATRPGGYAGLIFTHGVAASLLLLVLSGGSLAALVPAFLALGSRLAMVWFVVVRCLDDSVARRALWLVPLRDLLGFALWVGGFFGSTIVWRGNRFRLGEGGKLLPSAG
jgi:ceramide glucosyltransferase